MNKNQTYLSIIFLYTLSYNILSCGVNDSAVLNSNKFDQIIKDTAGPSSIDCGKIGVEDNHKDINNCVIDSYSVNKAFYARYDSYGDGEFNKSFAIALNYNSELFFFDYENGSVTEVLSGNGNVNKTLCKDPVINDSKYGLPLKCNNE